MVSKSKAIGQTLGTLADEKTVSAKRASGYAAVERGHLADFNESYRTDPEVQERVGKIRGGTLRKNAERELIDPEFAARMDSARKRGSANAKKIRRRCRDCGIVSMPGPLGFHLRSSGHSGYEEVSK